MAAAPTIKRSPDQFADDLSRLVEADWNAVWPGARDTEPGQWARQIGWQLTRIDPDLNVAVRLATGATITLFREHGSDRISQAEQVLWQGRAARAADNPAVIDEAIAVWPSYLAIAQNVLGPAPASAEDGPLPAARWPLPAIGADVALWVNLAAGTTAGNRPGSASVRLAVTPRRNEP